MSDPWWVGWQPPNETIAQAPTKAIFAQQNVVPLKDVYGPFTAAQANAYNGPGSKPGSSGGSGNPPLSGWWVIEQFYPDGSAKFGVSQFTSTPAPPDNQVVYGTWPTKAQATAAINDGSFRHAPHVYRGGNVSGSGGNGGPGGINIPGNQAPGNPVPGVNVLGGVSNFFHALTQKNTWIRVVEVLLGGALLLIGLAKLASGTQVGKAAKGIAMKAALI